MYLCCWLLHVRTSPTGIQFAVHLNIDTATAGMAWVNSPGVLQYCDYACCWVTVMFYSALESNDQFDTILRIYQTKLQNHAADPNIGFADLDQLPRNLRPKLQTLSPSIDKKQAQISAEQQRYQSLKSPAESTAYLATNHEDHIFLSPQQAKYPLAPSPRNATCKVGDENALPSSKAQQNVAGIFKLANGKKPLVSGVDLVAAQKLILGKDLPEVSSECLLPPNLDVSHADFSDLGQTNRVQSNVLHQNPIFSFASGKPVQIDQAKMRSAKDLLGSQLDHEVILRASFSPFRKTLIILR